MNNAGVSKLSVKFICLLLALCASLCWSAPSRAQSERAPLAISTEAQGFLRRFAELLPDSTAAQKAVLRDLAVSDGVRLKPVVAPDELQTWLVATAAAAQTTGQKRAAIQDFLLLARAFEQNEAREPRRLGLRCALAALNLAGEDLKLRADISAAFAAPFALDGDANGDLMISALLEPLWPRYGRIIKLEIQTPAQIEAMKLAGTSATKEQFAVPPLQIEAGNALTVPFLRAMGTVPGARQNWAIYRLARLFRARNHPQLSLDWFRRLQFGDGAGVFLRQQKFYDAQALPDVVPQRAWDSRVEKNFVPISGRAVFAWEHLRQLVPADLPAAQARFLDELETNAAAEQSTKRAEILRKLAAQLALARQPDSNDLELHQAAYLSATAATTDALMALIKRDEVENGSLFRSPSDWQVLARANTLFLLPQMPYLSGLNFTGPTDLTAFDAIEHISATYMAAGDLTHALPALELRCALAYEGYPYEWAMGQVADFLVANGRLEDALLCWEILPPDSSYEIWKVRNAPGVRRRWAEQVALVDPDAVITQREMPETP